MSELLTIMQNRRSERSYRKAPIPQEKIEKIIEAALLSASGKSLYPTEFIVVTDRAVLKGLAGCRTGSSGKLLASGGCAIVVIGDEEKSDTYIEDAAIAMTNMHLMASSLGLASCWVQGRLREASDGQSTEEYMRSKLGFPKNYRLEAMLAIGIPEKKMPPHDMAKLHREKVHFDKF